MLCTNVALTAERPNVLFIAVDDLRPSIGCYGDVHAKTPHLDRLAARSVQFDRAYCQVAVCNPSRATLLTGLRPDTLGVWTLPVHFREAKPDAVTLPQWFRQFGYTAVSHGKIFHNPTPDPQSWSEPIRSLPKLPAQYPAGTDEKISRVEASLPSKDWRKNNLRGPITASPELEDEQLLDGARTEMAIEDLRRLGKSSQPFFLAMGYIRPHLPWVSPKKYWDLHDPDKLPVVVDQHPPKDSPPYAMSTSYELTHYMDQIDFPTPWADQRVTESDARRLMHAYYASISYIDALIGKLLGVLEEEGLANNTIVVVWSDHGWKLGEHNGWGKMTNYEIDTRVPLLISSPHLNIQSRRTSELAELLDLYPTLCDLCGLDTPGFVEGTSLVPHMKDATRQVKQAAFSQYYRQHEGREFMGYAMRTDRYRYVQWRDFSTGEMTAEECYDHVSDPNENENTIVSLRDNSPDVLKELRQSLSATHPPRALSMLPAVHSDPSEGRWKTDITFINKCNSSVRVYPITVQGHRAKPRELGVGESVTINARIGGVFVAESDDGKLYEIHSPSYPSKTVVLSN